MEVESKEKQRDLTARQYVLLLRSAKSEPPDPIRLRALLKLALRCFGFRCVSVREVSANDERL
jgi:hypothetical protein